MAHKPSAPDVVSHVVAAISYVAHVFEVMGEWDLDDDSGDYRVACAQADEAGEHLAVCMWALHPHWVGMEQRALEREALTIFRRHEPPLAEVTSVLELVHAAVERVMEGLMASERRGDERRGGERRYREVASELTFAHAHLENLLYLIDPRGFADDYDASTPEDRVLLASRIELIELELEESRRLIHALEGSDLLD